MDYIDRLLQRARALPRDGAPTLFDPFDQSAPALPLEAPAATASPASAAAQATIEPVRPLPPSLAESAIGSTSAEPVSIPPLVAAPVVSKPSRASSPEVTLPPPEPALQAVTPPTPSCLLANADERVARADAFMRELGLAPPHEPTLTPMLAARIDPAPAAMRVEPSQAREPTPSRRQAVPATILPIAPAPAPIAVPRERIAARTPASAAAPTLAPPAQAENRATPERIAATTVVVTRGRGRALDDLAHSSGIARFGLGQW